MSDGTATKLFALLPTLVVTTYFWKGLLLGMQENPDDEHTMCMETWDILFNLL